MVAISGRKGTIKFRFMITKEENNLIKVLVSNCKNELVINKVRETISKRDCKKRPTSLVLDSLMLKLVRDLTHISFYIPSGFVGWIEEENLKHLNNYGLVV